MATAHADYGKLSVEETLEALGTSRERGLPQEEIAARLKEYGPNEIPKKEESLFQRISRRFWGPIPWMIEAAALLSALLRKWDDFTIIAVLLLTNAALDFWQESKALNALKVLKNKLAKQALVLRDGKFTSLDARNLVPGDIIKVKIGDMIPADIKLIDGEFLQADQSALTGESLPVAKKAGDIAYSNSIVKQGEMIGVVTATALGTFFGRTVALVAKAQKEEKSHFQKAVVHIGNYLILITLFLAAIILITAMFRHENMLEILRFTLVLTVAAIPVALPAVLTVTMTVGAMNLARKQAIVSRLVAIEELAGVDVLCSDKTGTLTQNRMTVSEPKAFAGHTVEELMRAAAFASKEENSDPIEIPIFEYLRKTGGLDDMPAYRHLKFTPFDPVSKRTEATVQLADTTLLVTKGAPQVILELCGERVDRQAILDAVEELAEKGYRTLGVASKRPEDGMFDFLGLIPLFDPPREDSKSTIEEAVKLGLQVKMITGDNLAIAKQIAAVLGIGTTIFDARDLRGASTRELVQLGAIVARAVYLKMSDGITEEEAQHFARGVVKELEREFERIELPEGYVKRHESEIIGVIESASGFAQVFPEDKYLIVEKLQKSDHIVGMTGDGVNDAPALKKADAGIAVSGATDAARAAADLVLLAPGLSVIVDAVKGARVTFERMKGYSIFRVAETIRVILFMTASIVVFNFYPVTAIMIIILAFLNDIPILTIAYDNTKVDNRPVRWNMTEVLTLATVLGVSGVISSFGIFYLAEEYMHLSPAVVQSFIFLKLVVAGHSTIYVTRTEKHFWQKPFPSPLLFSATTLTEILGTLFAVYGVFLASIGWGNALLVWGYALAWFVLNDFIKVWTYRYLRRDANSV
ncbi:plasma-membrane proton-efflux P-type ATPase [Geobacter sulfurreducens]|uniref:Cation-translocating P-type ATPase n=1 Tax=Geobacter sulfurreducens (strain ATCC 51573 / DSM 12127 / PCA) TaxID=243231 RepID=Q74AK3_GEOSL|nr:plasma-membrane proton-efflux P-type ATPase [Geobacter sulfurreducens]AAR35725.1 cation-translocating P-type ATPase [Geobacter sulfurreducens PCA]ADI85108.1 cation-translocating P-type ATPase [Geobacter sulfurreducens KN400]UAC03057.1 plasma-membrane proton-efflux P-type ATPase [Geobacter sulfurreducens]HBB68894.1 plasma-membrane proton-efflux P-type ATPase [Geobacter sulfurreducens]HCD95110.1 plasma-membrane proton-efflux P-type ATPase [Geobacter sulfurreducens]